MAREIQNVRQIRLSVLFIAGFEDGVGTMCQGMWVVSRTECGPQLTTTQEMGTSVLQPLGTEFCQQPK